MTTMPTSRVSKPSPTCVILLMCSHVIRGRTVHKGQVYRGFECIQWADNRCISLGPDTLLITLSFDDDRKWSAEVLSNNIFTRAQHTKAVAESNRYYFENSTPGCPTCIKFTDRELCQRCSNRGFLTRVVGMYDPPLKVDLMGAGDRGVRT